MAQSIKLAGTKTQNLRTTKKMGFAEITDKNLTENF
jgi:hypothetical protein